MIGIFCSTYLLVYFTFLSAYRQLKILKCFFISSYIIWSTFGRLCLVQSIILRTNFSNFMFQRVVGECHLMEEASNIILYLITYVGRYTDKRILPISTCCTTVQRDFYETFSPCLGTRLKTAYASVE